MYVMFAWQPSRECLAMHWVRANIWSYTLGHRINIKRGQIFSKGLQEEVGTRRLPVGKYLVVNIGAQDKYFVVNVNIQLIFGRQIFPDEHWAWGKYLVVNIGAQDVPRRLCPLQTPFVCSSLQGVPRSLLNCAMSFLSLQIQRQRQRQRQTKIKKDKESKTSHAASFC